MEIHHISIFVADMNRALYLFNNILGFELAWHIEEAKGKTLSDLLGIKNMVAEIAYLSSKTNRVSIELSRMIHPVLETSNSGFGHPGTVGLSVSVHDLDSLHERLGLEGWTPLSRCLDLKPPGGPESRGFCIKIEDSLLLEFIEKNKQRRHCGASLVQENSAP